MLIFYNQTREWRKWGIMTKVPASPTQTKELNLILESKRLVLRPYQDSDLNSIHAYSCDTETTQFMQWGPNSLEQTKDFFTRCIANQTVKPKIIYDFAVIDNASNQLIGSITLRLIKEGSLLGEIGYIYAKETWGKGYASEAARRVMQFGFQDLGLKKISATCDPENIGSTKVLQKAGMKFEGFLSKHLPMKGKWRDSLLYGCAESDFETNLQSLLKETEIFVAENQEFTESEALNGVAEDNLCQLFGGGSVSRLKLKAGAIIPTHSHVLDEVVIILTGKVKAGENILKPQDILRIPGACFQGPYEVLEDCLAVAVRLGPKGNLKGN
jgi:RimJ/RimL family protein N-acetyltransferase